MEHYEFNLKDCILYNNVYYSTALDPDIDNSCALYGFIDNVNFLYIPRSFESNNRTYYVTNITFLFYRKLLDLKQNGIHINIEIDNDNAYIKKYKDAIYTVFYYRGYNFYNQHNTLLYYINSTKSNYYYIDKYADSIYLESLLVDKNINYIEIENDYLDHNLSDNIPPLSGFVKNNIIYIKNKDRNLLYYNNKFKVI